MSIFPGTVPTPDTMKYCLFGMLFPPGLPPIPSPTPPLGTGVGEISISSFWFYSSESLETGKPTHSLDLSSLPKRTARQIRI